METVAVWKDQRTPALAIVARGDQIEERGEASFVIKSQSTPGKLYAVSIGKEPSCECDHFRTIGRACIHVLAARYYLEIRAADGKTERVRLTYPQAWAAYDAAQTREVELFGDLLRDLLADLPEPPHENGRPPVPLRDQIFCAVSKVHSTMSARRAHGLFRSAESRQQIQRAPHYIVSSRLLNREDVTPILHDLIARSALPLAGLESHFAVDSTGFRTSSFNAYMGEKHGDRREHKWLKAHFLVGTKTHVVAGVKVTDPTGAGTADSPQLPILVAEANARGFRIEALSADKAYSGRANHEAVGAAGGEAFIPFKSNATGKTRGSPLWKKAFHFFQLHRDEFDAKYHRRSNVESANSAIKRKFGEALRSKNRVAQENELLAKVLAYNLVVLIHEMFENGISPDWLRRLQTVVQKHTTSQTCGTVPEH